MLSLDSFIELTREKKRLEHSLKKIKEMIASEEGVILKYFEKLGISNVKKDGVTISIRRTVYAGREEGITHEAACEALGGCGLEEYGEPRVDTQGLSAFFRECEKEDIEFPDNLKGIIKISEKFKVVALGVK